MKEYAKLAFFKDSFGDEISATCIIKNVDGSLEVRGDSEGVVNKMYNIISKSAGRSTIDDPKRGVEYILSRLMGVSGRYSSNGEFTEQMFENSKKDFSHSKSFKVITTKRNKQNDE